VTHKIKNIFELEGTKLRLTLSQEEVNQIRIVDKERNPFFKVVKSAKKTKKPKAGRILKPKTVPFSEAKPKKRLKVVVFGEEFLDQKLGVS
jgi:hypothetical protein